MAPDAPSKAKGKPIDYVGAIRDLMADIEPDSTVIRDAGDHTTWGAERRSCGFDAAEPLMVVVVGPDGQLACDVPVIPERVPVQVRLYSRADLVDSYEVTLVKGKDREEDSWVRGDWSKIKELAEKYGKLELDGFFASASPIKERVFTFGPFESADVNLKVEFKEASISVEKTIKVAHLYPVNLSLLTVVSEGIERFSVDDGAITRSKTDAELDYFAGLHWYFLAHPKVVDDEGKATTALFAGRYFQKSLQRDGFGWWADRISLVGGASFSEPKESGFLGLALEPISGLSLTAGWQPQKVAKLKSGFSVGDSTDEEAAPVRKDWDTSRFGGGVALDVTIAEKILSGIFGFL